MFLSLRILFLYEITTFTFNLFNVKIAISPLPLPRCVCRQCAPHLIQRKWDHIHLFWRYLNPTHSFPSSSPVDSSTFSFLFVSSFSFSFCSSSSSCFRHVSHCSSSRSPFPLLLLNRVTLMNMSAYDHGLISMRFSSNWVPFERNRHAILLIFHTITINDDSYYRPMQLFRWVLLQIIPCIARYSSRSITRV